MFKPLVLSQAWIWLYEEPRLNAAISKGQLFGLENIRKEKLRKNVSREYITPETRVCGVVLKYCCDCFKETIEMGRVPEKGRFQWRRRLLLLSNFTRWGFDSTTQKEFSMKILFQNSDNPERKPKLQIVQLLRQWTQSFFRELRGEFHGNDNRKLCINRNTQRQLERNKQR